MSSKVGKEKKTTAGVVVLSLPPHHLVTFSAGLPFDFISLFLFLLFCFYTYHSDALFILPDLFALPFLVFFFLFVLFCLSTLTRAADVIVSHRNPFFWKGNKTESNATASKYYFNRFSLSLFCLKRSQANCITERTKLLRPSLFFSSSSTLFRFGDWIYEREKEKRFFCFFCFLSLFFFYCNFWPFRWL